MKLKVFLLVVLLFLISLGYFFIVWKQFHQAVALHVPSDSRNLAQFSLTAQDISLTSADGFSLSAWYIPVKNPKAVLVLVHGYGTYEGGKPQMLSQAKYLSDSGYSTILLDLRSFGKSQGSKIMLGTKEWQDVAAAYDYAKSRPENKNIPVGLLGVSMGGVTSIITAAKTQKADFVIAQVPFYNYQSFFRQQLVRLHYSPYLRPIIMAFFSKAVMLDLGVNYNSYSPNKLIGNIHVPILIMSAQNDDWVNNTDGQKLYDLANNPKMYWFDNTSHNLMWDDPQGVQTKVLQFLNQYVTSRH